MSSFHKMKTGSFTGNHNRILKRSFHSVGSTIIVNAKNKDKLFFELKPEFIKQIRNISATIGNLSQNGFVHHSSFRPGYSKITRKLMSISQLHVDQIIIQY